jgi:putative ABC transport system permease protein
MYLDALDLAPQGRAGVQLMTRDRERVWRQFDAGGLIPSDSLAWRLDLEPGDMLELTTPEGVEAFPVAGVYREYGNDRGSAMVSRELYRRIWGDDDVTSLGLYLEPGVRPEAMMARLRDTVGDAQALHFRSRADLRDLSMRIFERTFVITRVLYWLAAGVAAIGLLSALLAWQLERARELAVLRALGVTPRGAAVLIGGQTAFMTLVALLAAIPAGLATAIMLIDVVNRRAFGWQIDLHVPAAPFVDALTLALAAAAAAAVYPAWRAARAPLAAAMREE